MSLRVVHPGLFSLLVDAGRPGWRALGVPVGGAADRAALAVGNALVGNPPDAPAVEFTLAGPTLEAEHRTCGAVFGAPFAVPLNGRPVPAGTTFTLAPGDILKVGGTPSGARGYLCAAGGFDGPLILGSRSGLDPLKAGDVLQCPPSRCQPRGVGFVSLPFPRGGGAGGGVHQFRVLDGPQHDWFSGGFFEQDYTVTPAANRMGVRLAGTPLTRWPGELASEAVAPGAVQITNDGLPVVLGVDGQTIGGYPKVAHVVRADLDLVGQLRPGDRVRFIRVTPDEAEAAARDRSALVRHWLARLRAADRAPAVG
ncbi:MAG: biotin-dependent carboxyltransferase family protein [Gemmataceae bacterium]|nr:biotin-dependent carboxyltransferase family protein [Gemmataceae bacterium]